MQTVCWAAASLPPATASLPPATQSVPAKAIRGRVRPQFGGLSNHHCSQVILGVSFWSPSKKLMEGGTEANLGCRISNVKWIVGQVCILCFEARWIITKYLEPIKQAISGSILALILTNTLQLVMLWHSKHESLGDQVNKRQAFEARQKGSFCEGGSARPRTFRLL